MKKIVMIIILLLCSCSEKNISETLFIASIGFEKYDGEEEYKYYGYFYLPLSSDIGKNENSESKGRGEYAKVKGNSIEELFKNISITTPLEVNFKHVSSIIISQELLDKEFIDELIDYVKYSLLIDYNFYVFVTKDELGEIFDFKNPNYESVLNSILVITDKQKDIYLVANPIHFLEFSRKYYLNRSIFIPMITVEEIWSIDGEKVKNFYPLSAIYYFKNEKSIVEKNKSSPYVKDNYKFEDKIKNDSVEFINYKLSLDFKDEIVIKISFTYSLHTSRSELRCSDIIDFVRYNVLNYLEEYKEIDPLDLSYYNTIFNENYSYENISIKVRCNLN